MELIWSKPAQYSLLEIATFVEGNFSQGVAVKTVNEIRKAVEVLRRNPDIGRKVDNLPSNRTMRRLSYKKDLIYYYVDNDTVVIVLVWDYRRNPETLKERLIDYCTNKISNQWTNKQ